ncbi:hypothetical protein [Pedobacter zeae]|uniref:Uncharacterized protein n=1 Tax=Pedobacter zeae TaxID=1737356 RepID=A0A7W6KAE0_9SPHI|nr:hypothetical protein [Pedobacter zeae]MBB4108148.1 hypothetical protein [Pedobacter zeae]GGG94690.1 hypothetical protein GCM10007422_05180 [Pedobacter zeae]
MKKTIEIPFINIAEEIKEKTGFILEHQVATVLEKHDWSVIHNRFYIDDVQSIQREMDLLVYKANEVDTVMVYTALIISCKKAPSKIGFF